MKLTLRVAVVAMLVAIVAIQVNLTQREQLHALMRDLAALRQERDELATQIAQANQRLSESRTPAPANPVLQSANSMATPAPFPAEPIPPPPTIEETKVVLSQVVSSVGRVNLSSGHIANIRSWAEREPNSVIPWIATLNSAKQREHTLEAVIASVTETDPELAFLLTGGIERALPRTNRRSDVIRAWASRDHVAAARAVASATDLSDADRERLTRLIERRSR